MRQSPQKLKQHAQNNPRYGHQMSPWSSRPECPPSTAVHPPYPLQSWGQPARPVTCQVPRPQGAVHRWGSQWDCRALATTASCPFRAPRRGDPHRRVWCRTLSVACTWGVVGPRDTSCPTPTCTRGELTRHTTVVYYHWCCYFTLRNLLHPTSLMLKQCRVYIISFHLSNSNWDVSFTCSFFSKNTSDNCPVSGTSVFLN